MPFDHSQHQHYSHEEKGVFKNAFGSIFGAGLAKLALFGIVGVALLAPVPI